MLNGKHIVIIVENLPVPFDRRVWQEASTLTEQGAKISVICPKMKGYTRSYECIDGIDIYRHPLPLEATGALGYLLEYSMALFWEFVLCWKIYFRKRFHVIQGCNPPDLIFLVALVFKLLGVKYVFDHHDINPELFIAKYGRKGMLYKLLLWVEKCTFATADYSIATNESYKEIAIDRGKMPAEKVTIVRSGPRLDRLQLTEGNSRHRKGRRFMVGYVGVIGAQEGLDLLLEVVGMIVARRQDIQFAVIGDGTELEKIKRMTASLELGAYIDFYGRVDDASMIDILNTAELCVNPDRPTEMNNLSTMNKIMEYMALRKPIVQFDLKEGRFSAGDASLYAKDVADFAEKIMWLLDHPEEREWRGALGYHRVLNELSWDFESRKLINLYDRILTTQKDSVKKRRIQSKVV